MMTKDPKNINNEVIEVIEGLSDACMKTRGSFFGLPAP